MKGALSLSRKHAINLNLSNLHLIKKKHKVPSIFLERTAHGYFCPKDKRLGFPHINHVDSSAAFILQAAAAATVAT
jgi:hypothetical protein